VDDFEQVLITAAVYGDVPSALARHTVRIEGGRIVDDGERPPVEERSDDEV
jgi:DNA replication and repair protein RecF